MNRSAIYAAITGDGQTLINDDSATRAISRWSEIILDAAPLLEFPGIAQTIRGYNPHAKIIGYQTMFVWNNPGGPALWQELWNAVSSLPHGLLYKPDGSYWISNVNLADEATEITFGSVLAKHLGANFDEIFLDVLVPNLTAGQTDIDYDRAGFASMDQFAAAWNSGVRALLTRLRSYLPTIGNYGPQGPPEANGWMVTEDLDGLGYDKAKQYLTQPYSQPTSCWAVSLPRGGGKDAPENTRRARWGYCLALLYDARHSFMRGENEQEHPGWKREHLDWWYPEYGVDLGNATGPSYYEPSVYSHSIVRRDFEHGVVLLNTADHAVSVYNLPLCHPPGGAWKTAWNVPAMDGMVLQK